MTTTTPSSTTPSSTTPSSTTTTQADVCWNSSLCENGGTCHAVSANESICYCAKYYYRLECEQMNGTVDNVIISRVFSRNNWADVLAVIDVTSSMGNCASTVVQWMTETYASTSIKMYVFFNDGDNKNDSSKVIGATSGIYATNASNVSEVQRVMDHAKIKGTGGDGPENDIEALLYGVKECPSCRNIVHIADNRATPRDLELLSNLTNRHIRVVPCQVTSHINPALLDIAIQTNGSLHTIEQDYINLSATVVNDTIKIGNQTYRRMINGSILI